MLVKKGENVGNLERKKVGKKEGRSLWGVVQGGSEISRPLWTAA